MVALYFGSEFCEDRLPGLAEAEAFCALACERDCEPALLTPLVTARGLQTVDRLLTELEARGREPAVVFNDWGVLGLLRDRHPSLPRRAGRLMNRSLRDPRAYLDPSRGGATHDASRCERLRRFFVGLGVAAIETDVDLDGGYLGDGPDASGAGLSRALHLPFSFAASGRSCPLKAALYGDGHGFSRALADPCPAPCRGNPLAVARGDTTLAHWRGGNTLFYEIPAGIARAWVSRTDRIVLHAAPAP